MSAFEPYEGTEPYIFVSYSRKDKDRVFPLLDALQGAGYRVWRDVGGIPWGTKWRETIADHIERSAVCLLFWSDAASKSRHCEAETEEMLAEEKRIVPVHLDDIPIPKGLRMYLRGLQSVKLDEFADAEAFAARLERETVFAPCKAEPEWNRIGQIQWKWDPSSGLLTIAKNEDWDRPFYASIPPYQADPIHGGSTAPWMLYREQIRAVEIRDDIHTIGYYAFKDCTKLTSVTIPNSVTFISSEAFCDCVGLTSVTIPDSVTSIGGRAFAGCVGLTSVTIPDSVETIDSEAFRDCEGLTSVTIPDSVTFIHGEAFDGCEGLTSVSIGDSVETIGGAAFRDCVGLTSVTIPDSVTTIGDWAFWGCTSLTSVTIPAGARFKESGRFASFPEHTKIVRRPPREDGP